MSVTEGVAEGSPSRATYTRKLCYRGLANNLLCASLQKIKQHQCPGQTCRDQDWEFLTVAFLIHSEESRAGTCG